VHFDTGTELALLHDWTQ
jgi:hypothetical protein